MSYRNKVRSEKNYTDYYLVFTHNYDIGYINKNKLKLCEDKQNIFKVI